MVLEGFRPGVVDRLGVDYETVLAHQPAHRLLLAVGLRAGRPLPFDGRPRTSTTSRWPARWARSAGRARSRRSRSTSSPTTRGGGTMAAFSVATALLARDRIGRGQYIDLAMSDGVMYLLAAAVSRMLAGGEPAAPGRQQLLRREPRTTTFTRRRTAATSRWARRRRTSGRTSATWWVARTSRPLQHETDRHPEIRAHLEATFRQRTRDEWFAELKENGALHRARLLARRGAGGSAQPAIAACSPAFPVRGDEQVPQIGVGPKLSETAGKPEDRRTPRPASRRRLSSHRLATRPSGSRSCGRRASSASRRARRPRGGSRSRPPSSRPRRGRRRCARRAAAPGPWIAAGVPSKSHGGATC